MESSEQVEDMPRRESCKRIQLDMSSDRHSVLSLITKEVELIAGLVVALLLSQASSGVVAASSLF